MAQAFVAQNQMLLSVSRLLRNNGIVDGVFHKNYDSDRHFRQSCNRIRHVHGEAITEIRENFSQYPKKKESTFTREV